MTILIKKMGFTFLVALIYLFGHNLILPIKNLHDILPGVLKLNQNIFSLCLGIKLFFIKFFQFYTRTFYVLYGKIVISDNIYDV